MGYMTKKQDYEESWNPIMGFIALIGIASIVIYEKTKNINFAEIFNPSKIINKEVITYIGLILFSISILVMMIKKIAKDFKCYKNKKLNFDCELNQIKNNNELNKLINEEPQLAKKFKEEIKKIRQKLSKAEREQKEKERIRKKEEDKDEKP